MHALVGGRVVTPDGVVNGATVEIDGDRIAAVSERAPARSTATTDLAGAWLLPGFVDAHMHGGGGHDVATSAEDAAAAVRFHRRHGTTTTLVSLVTAPVADLVARLEALAALARDPGLRIHGVHLEGPFLAEERCGAQNPAHLRDPDAAAVEQLLAAGGGITRMITLAPERPGALDLVERCVDAGVVAALGHSDAHYAEATAAVERGASVATHLFNGMRPLHHRDPGLVGAALESGIFCELINDGIHVHGSVLRLVAERPDRLVLVTDAIDATGAGDGIYDLGGQEVQVRDGRATLTRTGALAGSTLTMDAAVRRAVREGLPIEVAARAAATNPARLLGLEGELGAIEQGKRADLVVLDADLRLTGVMVGGAWEELDTDTERTRKLGP